VSVDAGPLRWEMRASCPALIADVEDGAVSNQQHAEFPRTSRAALRKCRRLIGLVGASHTALHCSNEGDGTTPGQLREVSQLNTLGTVAVRIAAGNLNSCCQSESRPVTTFVCLHRAFHGRRHGNPAQIDGLDCCFCGTCPWTRKPARIVRVGKSRPH
jgi:hypothetical protein